MDGLSDLCRRGLHHRCRLCGCTCHPETPMPEWAFVLVWFDIMLTSMLFWALVVIAVF